MPVKGNEDKNKVDKSKNAKDSWWSRQSEVKKTFMFIGGLLGVIVLVFILGLVNVAYQLSENDVDDVTSANISNNVSNVSTVSNNSNVDKTEEDKFWSEYKRGQYDGYLQGYNDASYGEAYNDYLTKGTNIADGYRTGYEASYRTGYEDSQAGREMNLPTL